nr:hypothetical protein [Sphingomonas sp. Y57]
MAWLWRNGVMVLMAGAMSPAAMAAPPAPTGGAAASMSLAALQQLEPGLWQLEVKGRGPRQICIGDPVNLVQIEHDQLGCSRFVIANGPRIATVHYSCQRAGWGRTTVRVETPRTAVIQTQGISRNAPFDYIVEARRIGACGGQPAARQR